jgi:hypothetical protein
MPMRFDNIPVEKLRCRITPVGLSEEQLKEAGLAGEGPKEQFVRDVSPNASLPDVFDLILATTSIPVKTNKENEATRLALELSTGRTKLARIRNFAKDGSCELEVAFFTGKTIEMDAIDIGLDEYVIEGYKRSTGAETELRIPELGKRLEDEFCFVQDDTYYFFMLAGAVVDEDMRDEEAIQNKQDDASEESLDIVVPIPDGSNADGADTENELPTVVAPTSNTLKKGAKFSATGKSLSFVAEERYLEDGSSLFVATRLTNKRQKTDKALKLAKGKLNFVDWTQAGRIQLLAKAQLSNILKGDSSYLKKWDEFGNVEGERLLTGAREFGVLYYSDATPDRNGTIGVKITEASDYALAELAGGRIEEVELVSAEPSYISNPDLTFPEFSRDISLSAQNRPGGGKRSNRSSYYKVIDYNEGTRTLVLDVENLKPSGELVLSLQGGITQIRRRNSARKAILEGRSANPQLGLLLEESGTITSLRLPQKQQALNAFVRNKIFKNPPTPNQEKAIEVALNTPDIALIQGPPGTGKTTVIAAICERLNQMAAKDGINAKGQILLTGLQHDAVENMIGRMSLDGIPVPKLGKLSGSTEDDLDVFERSIEEWCDEIIKALRAKHPELTKIDQEREIENLSKQYIKTPTQALAAALTGKIAVIPLAVMGEKLYNKAARVAKQQSVRATVYSEGSSNLIRSARQIRTRKDSFLDDGPERAEDALEDLRDVLEAESCRLLEKASTWEIERGLPPFLDDLKNLKKSLLTQLTAPPHFRVEKASDEVLDLAKAAIERLREKGLSAQEKRLAALAAFLSELEGDFYGTVEAVSDYSFAFAATVQQSVGQKMQEMKGVSGIKGISELDNTRNIEYEYVIVDEAARVSPRDLMIPMAQGKRIILVGDHRQLPHIIDEEVARQMDEGESADNEIDWLKKSMFEYLFTERLKALEEADGIPRRVTLDKQFRMHPILGDFISRNFYERFSAEERVASGLPESLFTHQLPGASNKAAAWMDVPAEMGRHRKKGTSWVRQPEADAIAAKLIEWITSEQGKDLSYGVISFYKAQAELIKKSLGKLDVDDKQLRIGTVDSFQGMEFDVVFLSMVRTLPQETIISSEQEQKQAPSSRKKRGGIFGLFAKDEELEVMQQQSQIEDPAEKKQAQRYFGHLCLYNRLNVSMSRQKKLLVVVGDQMLISNALAHKYIPGLVDFHRLCAKEGVLLPCQ